MTRTKKWDEMSRYVMVLAQQVPGPEWYPAGLFGACISRSPKQNRSNICIACSKQDKKKKKKTEKICRGLIWVINDTLVTNSVRARRRARVPGERIAASIFVVQTELKQTELIDIISAHALICAHWFPFLNDKKITIFIAHRRFWW